MTRYSALMIVLITACDTSDSPPASSTIARDSMPKPDSIREIATLPPTLQQYDSILSPDERTAIARYKAALTRIDQPGGAAAAFHAAHEARGAVATLLEAIPDDSVAVNSLRLQLPGIEMHKSEVSIKVWPQPQYFAPHGATDEEREYLSMMARSHDRFGLPVWETLYTDETSVLSLEAVDTTGIARLLARSAADTASAYAPQLRSLFEDLMSELERPCSMRPNDAALLPRILAQLDGSPRQAGLAEVYAPFIKGERQLEACRAG